MADAFDGILGQPQVRSLLRSSLAGDRVSHAYLFHGPAGSSKTRAATALAQALVCPHGGCGTCEVCAKVARHRHPDVRFEAPEGAAGYVVAQVRAIVSDVSLAPIQAARKVYVLDRADLMNAAAANAFLKTLEEPPADVVLILLARTREGVLPTIASRCLAVPFRQIPPDEAADLVAQAADVTPSRARVGLAACGGSIERAVSFVKSNERMEFRREVLHALEGLEMADAWDVVGRARGLVVLAKAPLDEVRAAHEAHLRDHADFLGKAAVRQIELRNKRELSARSLESLRQIASIAGSFLRDVLAVCAECPDLVQNADVRSQVERCALAVDEARVVRALDAVSACESAISYNVSPETCVSALLFELREALYGSHSPRSACL
ncbi:DNA polymerase III subunit delta' [Eggerthellaceae bacterium zg-997]|nr:DNA polymerase III subunit delta' [Eggerthellaceae bacterium zg-997]